MSLVVGIDPSLSNTVAIVLQRFADGSELYEKIRVKAPSVGPEIRFRYPRFLNAVAEIVRRIRTSPLVLDNSGSVDAIAIEDYAYGASDAYQHFTTEFCAILRLSLLEQFGDVEEISNTRIKQWASGKGNTKKAAYTVAIAQREKLIEIDDDNAADAAAIARIAQQLNKFAPTRCAFERETIAKMLAPKEPKKKKEQEPAPRARAKVVKGAVATLFEFEGDR